MMELGRWAEWTREYIHFVSACTVHLHDSTIMNPMDIPSVSYQLHWVCGNNNIPEDACNSGDAMHNLTLESWS
jgi:hypothetical protein